MINFVRATPGHAHALAARLRTGDKQELRRAGQPDFARAVLQSVQNSPFAFAAYANNKLLCVFGLVPDSGLSVRARVWLLGTTAINQHKKSFLRACREVLAKCWEIYPVLYNAVDQQYPQALRLLRALGATFGQTLYGPDKDPFVVFFLIKNRGHLD